MRSLKNDFEFKQVFDNGKKVVSKHETVFALPNSLSELRVGIICSRRLSKKAVERNKIRRRVKAVIGQLSKPEPGFDLIILPKFVWVKGKFDDLASTLNKSLTRAGIC